MVSFKLKKRFKWLRKFNLPFLKEIYENYGVTILVPSEYLKKPPIERRGEYNSTREVLGKIYVHHDPLSSRVLLSVCADEYRRNIDEIWLAARNLYYLEKKLGYEPYIYLEVVPLCRNIKGIPYNEHEYIVRSLCSRSFSLDSIFEKPEDLAEIIENKIKEIAKTLINRSMNEHAYMEIVIDAYQYVLYNVLNEIMHSRSEENKEKNKVWDYQRHNRRDELEKQIIMYIGILKVYFSEDRIKRILDDLKKPTVFNTNSNIMILRGSDDGG